MSHHISDTDSQLTKMFGSIKHDTPDLTRTELAELISTAEATVPLDGGLSPAMRHNNIFRNKKGMIMSLVTVMVAGVAFFAIQSQRIDTPIDRTISNRHRAEVQRTEQTNSSSLTTPATSVQNKESFDDKKHSLRYASFVNDPALWEKFVQKPIDLSLFNPIEVDPETFASLGVHQTDSGEVIYYHRYQKIGFPVSGYMFPYENGKNDPLTAQLSNRSYYAEYVTDSRGYMMMHYVTNPVNGGYSISLRVFDRDLAEEMKSITYFGITNTNRTIVLSDKENDVLKVRIVSKAGIMRVDTVLTGKISDQEPLKKSEKEIETLIRRRDTVLKLEQGGMGEIAKKYPFNFSDSATSPLVKKVLLQFSKIKTKGKTELAILSEKISVVNKMLETEMTVEGCLRLEQLQIRLYYDSYAEQNKVESEAIQNSADLIPIKVRAATGMHVNPAFDNGLIFWYRDSDTLREVLNMPKSTIAPSVIEKLAVLPNPSSRYLYVDYQMDATGPMRITLLDITGKQVHTEAWRSDSKNGKKEINVESFAPGIYMLVVDTEKGSTTRQVIVRR